MQQFLITITQLKINAIYLSLDNGSFWKISFFKVLVFWNIFSNSFSNHGKNQLRICCFSHYINSLSPFLGAIRVSINFSDHFIPQFCVSRLQHELHSVVFHSALSPQATCADYPVIVLSVFLYFSFPPSFLSMSDSPSSFYIRCPINLFR